MPVFGLLSIHKPAGMPSRQIVDVVIHLAHTPRVGHAGTLDPMATGVLVVAIDKATRLLPFVQEQSKEYRARFILGKVSDTDDMLGNVSDIPVTAVPTQTEIEKLLPRFIGLIEQVSPDYSAVRVKGHRAHWRARRGEQVTIAPRTVEIHRLELTEYCYPELELTLECGSGTYVRSIGRDLGQLLGCGATMSALTRTRVGFFPLSSATTLAQLTPATWHEHVLSPLAAVANFHSYQCTPAELREITHGRVLRWEPPQPLTGGEQVTLVGTNDELLAITRYRPDRGGLKPEYVFAPRLTELE